MKRNQIRGRFAVLSMVLALAYSAFALAQSYEGPLFETHSHIVIYQSESGTDPQYNVDAREGATVSTAADYIASLDRNNITCTLGFHGISFDSKQQDLLDHATRLLDLYPDRFILSAEIFRDNPLTWYDSTSLDTFLDEGLFAGFGEIQFANYPLGPDDDHPTTTPTYPNDARFQQIYTVLGDRGLFAMAHPDSRLYLADAISYDPTVTWIIHGPHVHSRWTDITALENLLDTNPNLYYTLDIGESLQDLLDLTKVVDATTGKADFLDAMNDTATFDDLLNQMVSTWQAVIERHPDQFLWGTDMALPTWHWDSDVIDKIALFSRAFIGTLETSAGEKYAYQNAERLFGECAQQGGEIQFSSASYTADEGVESSTITVQRTGLTARTVTVDWAASDGTSGTLTFGPGVTSQTFTVSIVDDMDVESSETVNLTLSSPTRGATLGATSTAVLTILNNDVAFRFSNAVYTVSEAGGAATITVMKQGGTPGTVTVDYATSDGTAKTAESDYTTASGTLTFGPSDVTKTFTVTILNDSTPETTETVNLTLSNPTNTSGSASLTTPTAAVLRIFDNDANVRFSAATYTVSEADGTATITVGRLGAITSAVTVDYATSDGTATAGSDYAAVSGTLTFAAGVTTATFSVSILSDSVSEGDETVQLTLTNAVGATLVAPSTAVLTITNVDTPAGTNVAVQPVDSTTGITPVRLTFDSVTTGGNTTLTTTSSGTAPTSGFQLGNPPTYYEISTTATFSGSVTVCINYTGVSVDDEASLRLYHYEGGAWVDVTTSLDTTNNIICGSVTSFSAFAIFEPIPLPVTIDIKPGSFPNSINLGSGGTVPVAIFSTSTFDARTLDPTTVTLASAPVKLRGRGTPMASAEDVNGDGLPDIVVHVSTEALQLHEIDTEAVLRGKTFDGRAVKGQDTVRVVP